MDRRKGELKGATASEGDGVPVGIAPTIQATRQQERARIHYCWDIRPTSRKLNVA